MSSHYALDLDWVKPFSPQTFEPSCLGTNEITITPREILDDSSSYFTFDFPSLGDRFINLRSVKLFVSGIIKKQMELLWQKMKMCV